MSHAQIRHDWGALATPVHDVVPALDGVSMPWRDNAIFFFWDAENEIYGVVHVSTSPHGSGTRARCSLTAGDRSREILEPLDAGTLTSESITVDLDGRLLVEHDSMQADLTLQPLFGPLDFTHDRAIGGLDDNHPLHHHQHPMRVQGTVTFGSEERALHGTGWRDRTWGFRDESVQWSEYACVIAVFDDSALVALKMRAAGDELRTFGWRVSDTAKEPVTTFELAHDASGLLADATIGGDGWVTQVTSVRRPAGFWVPMGDRQAGPAFSTFDEFVLLERPDGVTAGGLAEHGILREVR
jgi:hypothetical protein